MEFSQPECESGISVPGALKLDHLQPVEPILFGNFPIISFSYLGPILITPESGGLKMGIWNSPNLSVRVGSLCPRHSNWTICSLLSQFFGNFSNYFTFILGGQFLLHQRVEDSIRENGILPT